MLMAAVELCIVSCLQYHHHFHNVVFLINVSNPIDATRRLLSSSKSAIKLNLIKILCRIFNSSNFSSVFSATKTFLFPYLSKAYDITFMRCFSPASVVTKTLISLNVKNFSFSLSDLWESLAINGWYWDQWRKFITL